jgi:FkbM family methyltransferase
LKKVIYRILCNKLTGTLILYLFKGNIPSLRYQQYKFDVTKANMDRRIIASIFWGFYESAEIRFIEKYFKGDVDAIELGASSGIVSSHIISKFGNSAKRFIGVEANRNLHATWSTNVQRHSLFQVNAILLNYAVYYSGESVKFALSGNPTESRISQNDSGNAAEIEVKSITLSDLINSHVIKDFALFCDIEGGELQMFLNEKSSLLNCKQIFIELHEHNEKSMKYTVNDLNHLIQEKGFELIDRHGAVHYYENRSKSEMNGA